MRAAVVGRAFLIANVCLSFLAVLGCTGSPIGDPCVPESVPTNGFEPTEVYLESSSVQCRTRLCMVYQLDGNPNFVVDEEPSTCPSGSTDCVMKSEVQQRVFCSCRCDVADDQDQNTPLCACPEDFSCVAVTAGGGAGLRGSYCVRDSLLPAGTATP